MVDYLKDKDKVKGQSYFMPSLDKLMGGGMREGEVTAWHAEAKVGKNSLWHKLLLLQMENSIPNGYGSRELTPETEVLPNMFSILFSENMWLSNRLDANRFVPVCKDWPLYFAAGYGHFPLDALENWINELQKFGVQYFWFDHLHYMLEEPEEHKAASKLIKLLKTLAKEKKIHINIIIQPNKLGEGQKLSAGSLKGGSAIGQAIDNLVVLERTWGIQNHMTVKLERARSKLCNLGKFYLKYDPTTTDLVEADAEEVEILQRQPQDGGGVDTENLQRQLSDYFATRSR
jgi:hypothetical protein